MKMRSLGGTAAMAVASWTLILGCSAVGMAASGDKPTAIAPPAKTSAVGTLALSRVLPKGGTLAMPALEAFAKRGRLGVLSDFVRFFTDNEAELLSENDTRLLSENKTKLLSDNRPSLLNGNTVKLFSDVNIFSGINVNVNIRIENSGNKQAEGNKARDPGPTYQNPIVQPTQETIPR
ncbi:MAG TPA: hypothetical protein DD670_19930 [Planctomycetaceae bacterium]|nr:hypothetical protein [Planctomycetaceae bacterium]